MRYLVYTLSNDDGEGDIELEILRARADLDSRGQVDMRRGDSGAVMKLRIYCGMFLFSRYMVRVHSAHLTRDCITIRSSHNLQFLTSLHLYL